MIQLPSMPKSIAKLPRDDRGYPVPWFVAWVNGKPEFRCADGDKQRLAITEKRCWVCGEHIGHNPTFVVGTASLINRCHGEPACHYECGLFSALACPFLTLPKAQRREANLPNGTVTSGVAIERNPGCCVLWVCRSKKDAYQLFRHGQGFLWSLPNPLRLEFYAEAKPATRDVIESSLNSARDLLEIEARKDGPPCVAELNRLHLAAYALLPGDAK